MLSSLLARLVRTGMGTDVKVIEAGQLSRCAPIAMDRSQQDGRTIITLLSHSVSYATMGCIWSSLPLTKTRALLL